MNHEQIETLFSNNNEKPDFNLMANVELNSILAHFGLKGVSKPKPEKVKLLNRFWSNFQGNKLYHELFEYIEYDDEEVKAIDTVKKLKDILPNKLGETNPQNSQTPLVYAINNEKIDVALEVVKTGYSNPGATVFTPFSGIETALSALIDSINIDLDSNKPLETINKKKDLAFAIISTGKSNAGRHIDSNDTALIYTCKRDQLLDIALEIIKTDKTNINSVNDVGYSALDNLIDYGLIDNDVFRELVKYYIFENPDDLHFQSVTTETICKNRKLKEQVKKSLQSVPELRNKNIEDYCAPPVSATAHLPIPVGVATNESAGLTTSVNEAVEIPITAGISESDNGHYIDMAGNRIAVPLTSHGEGERIPKRLGGKTQRKNKKKSITRKKRTHKTP